MATVSKGRVFVSGETVTPAKLNELVDNATVTAIQTADISDSQITTAKIVDGAVTTAKLADANVTNAKLASGIDAAKLTTGTLPADRIGSSAITTARINDGAVTAAKLDGAQTGSAPIYGCRAWVNFNGTAGTTVGGEFRCTIRASGNVTKVVRNSTGDYTVHFTTSMPDANYCAVASSRTNSGVAVGSLSPVAYSSSAIQLYASGEISSGGLNYVGANFNVNHVICSVAIFR